MVKLLGGTAGRAAAGMVSLPEKPFIYYYLLLFIFKGPFLLLTITHRISLSSVDNNSLHYSNDDSFSPYT
jgi:hypothetical protein